MTSELLEPYLDEIRIPTATDRVYKDECIFSFDTPDSPEGIFVCMKTFFGFSRRFMELYHAQTGASVFLHLRRVAHPIAKPTDSSSSSVDEPIQPKVTRLALNVEGGFQTNKPQFEFEEINMIILMPGYREIRLSQLDLPEKVVLSVTGLLSADSAAHQAEAEALRNTWDGEKRVVSKHANNLQQLKNGVKVPPIGWKCQNCDIRDGLWLNLTDGSIFCGRKYFDGTGGNNHAEEHYKATGYPLVVKLGTITAQGADVYSYAEDNMVEDPKLVEHLAHFGINVTQMAKTEKTMIEMEIDLNQRYDEWSIIQEDGAALKSLFGPGFTGMTNLGNSCYLNSVMQVLFTIPDFISEFYIADKTRQYSESNRSDPIGDLKTQLMKLAAGLLSGDYATPSLTSPVEQSGIKPRMFKSLIGRNHAEFNTRRQQDAQEFLLHVLDLIERMPGRAEGRAPPTDAFKFEVEERVQCSASGGVRYKTRKDFLLSLPIEGVPIQNKAQYEEFLATKAAVEAAGDKIDSDQVIRPIIKMSDCFAAFAHDGHIEDFYSSAIKGKTTATQRLRMKTFPDYLILQMKKFTLGADWTPKKLDVSLEVPEKLDLEYLRAKGIQPGEVPLPEETSTPPPGAAAAAPTEPPFEPNAFFLNQLKDMGFNANSCRRALYHTKNVGVEPAMNWILDHMNDADFAAPFVPPNASAGGQPQAANIQVDPEALSNIISMGIEERHARLALKMNNNNTEHAVGWIFNNMQHIDTIEREEEQRQRAASLAAQSAAVQHYRDGPAKYELVALVSHMGQSTLCGHYVAHIRKQITPGTVMTSAKPKGQEEAGQTDDPPASPAPVGETKWIIFNDSKVAISEKPPVPFAYLYLYKRITE